MSAAESSSGPPRLVLGGVLLAGVSAISAAAIFIRCADAPGVSTALWRTAFSALMMGSITAVAVLTRGTAWRLGRRELGLCAVAGVFLGLHFWSWMTSLQYTSVASSVLFVTMNPIFVGVMSPLVTQDRMTRRLWMGIVLAVVGGLVIGYEDVTAGPSTSLLGNGLALLGAVCMSGYLVVGRLARESVSLEVYATVTNMAAALLLLPAVLLTNSPLFDFPLPTWGWFLLIALVPQLIGHNSLVWALRHVSAPVVALAILAEPIGAGALAWVVFDELPGAIKIAGAAVLLGGIFLASLNPTRRTGRRLV